MLIVDVNFTATVRYSSVSQSFIASLAYAAYRYGQPLQTEQLLIKLFVYICVHCLYAIIHCYTDEVYTVYNITFCVNVASYT